MKNIRQALPQISSQDLIMNTVTIQILTISGFQIVNFNRESGSMWSVASSMYGLGLEADESCYMFMCRFAVIMCPA